MSEKKQKTEHELQLQYSFEWHVNFKARTLTISEDIDDLFCWFDAAMTELESQSRKAITVKLNTYGGDLYDSTAIISRIRASKCYVVTEAYGKVMSAGIGILACGARRRMCKWATAMHHSCSYSTGWDKHAENKNYVKQIEVEDQRRFLMLEEFTGTPFDYWQETAQGVDRYLTAEQCLNLGIVDEIF